jgi:hypothetical protein
MRNNVPRVQSASLMMASGDKMGEAERLKFMADLLESVAQALRDLNDGLHCFAEDLCQGSEAFDIPAATIRHYCPTFMLADRVHYFDQTIRDQQHAIRRGWRRKKRALRFLANLNRELRFRLGSICARMLEARPQPTKASYHGTN